MISHERLIQLLFESVVYRATPEEVEAASKPPYPLPTSLIPFYDVAKEALQQRLAAGGPDPLCSLRLYDYASCFSGEARLWLLSKYRQDVFDAICLLLAGGVIPVATVERVIEICTNHLAPRHMQRAIIYRLCADGETDAATQAADSPVFGDVNWVGWRAVGDYYARNGNAAMCLKLWPKYKTVHRRDDIDTMRRDLVGAVSRRYGWREAVKLTSDKRVSTKKYTLMYVALKSEAEIGDVKAIDRLLNTEDLPGLNELARLQLLIDAMQSSYPKHGEPGSDDDHPDLSWVLPRIIAIDPKVCKENSGGRDSLLVGLWSVIADPATLKKVRAAIYAPLWRRQLAGLKEN